MDEKEKLNQEKLNQIKNLLEDYEQRKYLVLPVYRIRAILDGKEVVKVAK